MKGAHQATCSGCGERKGSHDRNAGWFEIRERGMIIPAHVFCPTCSGVLLVGLDERMGKGGNPNLRAMLVGDIERIRRVVEASRTPDAGNGELRAIVHWLADLVGRKPWDTIDRLTPEQARDIAPEFFE